MRYPEWNKRDVKKLVRLYPDHTAIECAQILGCKVSRIYAKAAVLGLTKSESFKQSDKSKRIQTGKQSPAMIATRFKAGHDSWNKGTKGITGVQEACRATQFKPGRRAEDSHNYQPIGAERITKDGYIERKVSDDSSLVPARRWQFVHRIVWEQANGPVPDGYCLRFVNGDKTDTRLENIECISRADNARRTVASIPPEIKKLNQLRGALQRQINKTRRENHEPA